MPLDTIGIHSFRRSFNPDIIGSVKVATDSQTQTPCLNTTGSGTRNLSLMEPDYHLLIVTVIGLSSLGVHVLAPVFKPNNTNSIVRYCLLGSK